MVDLEKIWNRVLDRGSKKAIANLRNVHANNPRFQELLKNRGEEGGSPSAAAAKKVKVEPRKIIAVKPDSIRALNAARQQAYLAKGGRQPIGAMGSDGSNVMAGGGQSTVKDLKASIKAGFNPRVSLDPYESKRAKKTGPRSLKMKKEELQIDEAEALSPEAAKKRRIFNLKLKLIKSVANKKSYTKPSKVDEPRLSLNPSRDLKLQPKSLPTVAVGHYVEEVQIDEITGYEGVKDRKDIIKRAAAMNRMGKDVFLARVKARAAEMRKEKASKEPAKEEVQIDEVSKKEAEEMLGGPVKDKPKGPAGKHPLGYRLARSAARRAMKGAISAVHKSMEKTMAKEEVEVVDEKVEIFHRQGPGADMERYHKDTSNPAAVLARKKAADAARTSRVAGDLKAKKMGQTMSTGNGGGVKAVSTTSQGFKKEEVEQIDDLIRVTDTLGTHPTGKDKPGSKPHPHTSALRGAAANIVRDYRNNPKNKKGGKVDYSKLPAKTGFEITKEEVEQVTEQDDSMEKKEMAQTQLHFMAYAAKEILEFIDMGGEIEEWYQNKLSKVQSEVESLHSYIEGEKRRTGMVEETEQIDEKNKENANRRKMMDAEKGAKFKSQGYYTPEPTSKQKDDQAHNKMVGRAIRKMTKEEAVTEAEGTVAVTPKQKALAAHHGDKTRITYGDVIKARLKSVAAKKMGK